MQTILLLSDLLYSFSYRTGYNSHPVLNGSSGSRHTRFVPDLRKKAFSLLQESKNRDEQTVREGGGRRETERRRGRDGESAQTRASQPERKDSPAGGSSNVLGKVWNFRYKSSVHLLFSTQTTPQQLHVTNLFPQKHFLM